MGGRGLFQYYPSFQKVLEAVYPDHSWADKVKPRTRLALDELLKDKDSILEALKIAEEKLGIKQVSFAAFLVDFGLMIQG